MNLSSPQPITERVILRPQYKRAATFTHWFAINEEMLIGYFRELGPEERGQDFADFAAVQYDSWRWTR